MALWQRHRWQRETRYYEVLLQQDLWGAWLLTRRWGRIGTPMGQQKHEPVADLDEGQARLGAISRRREQRGYTRTNP